jgi:hypothetical protein
VLDFDTCGINIGKDVYSGCNGGGGGFLDGQLDDIRIYNYARTPAQVIQDMNGGHPLGGSPVGSQVVYYNFDEMYGTTANNKIDTYSSVTGSISGATWTQGTSCKYNNCLDFDGTDDVVTVTNASGIDMDIGLSGGFTVSTWFNADSDGENNTGEIWQKGTNTYCRTDSESGGLADLECNLDLATTDANVNITDGVTINQWHHLAFVYDGTATITVYIDGYQRGSNTGSGATASDANNLLIGGNTGDNFDGTIDDFKIYSSALTQEQVLIDMNANSSINLSTGSRKEDDFSFTILEPVGHWQFDENTGTGTFTTYDTSINSNNATAQSSMTSEDWVPGVYGSALDFDGSDDQVSISNTSTIDFDTGLASGFSFSGWIYIHSDGGSNQGRFFQKGNTRCDTRSESGSNVTIACNLDLTGSDAFDTGSGVSMNEWHHFVYIYDNASNYKLYLDGELLLDATGTGDTATDTSTLYIGGGVNAYDGLVDDFKIFDQPLTYDQINYEYNRGKPVAHWKLDECSGSTINDSSGNGLAGTIPSQTSGSNTSVGSCNGSSGQMWNDGATGKFNASLEFDGTDDYITITDSSKLSPGANNMTVSAWYKTSTDFSTSGWIYQAFGSVGNNQIALGMSEFDAITCIYMDGDADLAQASHTSTSNDGNWHHAACVRNGTTVNLYIDGHLVRTDTDGALGTIDVTGDDQAIGTNSASNGTQNFSGQIDDVRVYNYALTANQVLNLMNNGSAVRF